MSFENKTIFITQASCPIGEALVEKLAAKNVNLVLGSPSEKAVALAEKAGAKVLSVEADLASFAGAQKLIEDVKKVFPRLDVVMFNNNKAVKMSIEDLDYATFRSQLDYNAKSAYTVTRFIGDHMAEYGNGKIVYITSIHNDKPTGSTPMFSISKGVVNMLCKEAALYYGRKGVQVNVVEPGALEGDDETFMSDFSGVYAYMDYRIPREKPGTPMEVANVAAFLAGDEASFVNGAFVRVDGGFMLNYGVK